MARPFKALDAEEIRKLSAFGCTGEEIANFVGCGRRTLVRRFQSDIEAGRAAGAVRAKGRIYQKGVLNGETKALEIYLANTCGWSGRPPVAVTTNVIQNGAPQRGGAEVKAHLVELQRAVWAEARRLENEQNQQLQLPPAETETINGSEGGA